MSAFDIAGAVTAPPLAILVWLQVFDDKKEWKPSSAFGQLLFVIVFTTWSVFCIARLFGASL